MKKKREKNVDEYIIEALFQLMEKKKYADISITEITDQAGVGRVSFYRNFDSKEDIITKWINQVTKDFLNHSDINFKNDTLEEYFFKLFTHLNKYKNETSLIYKANLLYLLKDKFEKTFLEINQDKYDNYKSYFMIGGIFNIYHYWIKNNFKESPKELSLKLLDLLEK